MEVVGDRLVISGEAKSERSLDDPNWRMRERSFGSFTRRLVVPAYCDPSQITANYDAGVLDVTVPKKEEHAERKAIEVQ